MGDETDRIDRALNVAMDYGSIDGGHHKAWVIDQMVRALLGSPEQYAAWREMQALGADGPSTYGWDEGTAP